MSVHVSSLAFGFLGRSFFPMFGFCRSRPSLPPALLLRLPRTTRSPAVEGPDGACETRFSGTQLVAHSGGQRKTPRRIYLPPPED